VEIPALKHFNNLRARAECGMSDLPGSIVQRYTTAAPRLTINFFLTEVTQKQATPLSRWHRASSPEIVSEQVFGDEVWMKI